MSWVTRWFITKTYYRIWYCNRLRGDIFLMYNTINSIIPLLFSFTVMLGYNLELIPTILEMNSGDVTIPSSSAAGSSNVIDLTRDNNENIEKPWIDLKLVKQKGNLYAVDNVQKYGVNLIEKLEPQAGQAKPELVTVKSSGGNWRGFQLEVDGST